MRLGLYEYILNFSVQGNTILLIVSLCIHIIVFPNYFLSHEKQNLQCHSFLIHVIDLSA